jgi:hypothetical protein
MGEPNQVKVDNLEAKRQGAELELARFERRKKRMKVVDPKSKRTPKDVDKWTRWAENGQQLCGKPLKNGNRCRGKAFGNGRCRIHGGLVCPGINTQPYKPDWVLTAGLYSDRIGADELDVYQTLKCGSLEQELRLLRIQLRRALKAQYDWEREQLELGVKVEGADGMIVPESLLHHYHTEAYEHETKDGVDNHGEPVTEDKRKVVRRRNDYKTEIKTLLNLISSTEAVHHAIIKDDLSDGDAVERLARDLRKFARDAAGTMPGAEGLADNGKAEDADVEMDTAAGACDPA